MTKPLKYTDEVIETIRTMYHAGASNEEIAMAIDTTPARLASRLSHLGLGRKALGLSMGIKPVGLGAVMIPVDVIAKFSEPAKARKLSPQQLIRVVLHHIMKENLLPAIMDDGK